MAVESKSNRSCSHRINLSAQRVARETDAPVTVLTCILGISFLRCIYPAEETERVQCPKRMHVKNTARAPTRRTAYIKLECTLCGDTNPRRFEAKLLWMTPHYGPGSTKWVRPKSRYTQASDAVP